MISLRREPKDFDIVLVVLVAIVWLTFVPARGPRRHSPPR
jgi:hypothetical protein